MDTFNFLISILIMMIAIQLKETWIALAILIISILTSKDLSTIIAFIIATVVLYIFVASGSSDLWPVAIFGLIIVSIVLSAKQPEKSPGMDFGGGGFGDMFGGGGYGGY